MDYIRLNIKRLIKESDLTIPELANKMGLTRQSLYNLIDGKTDPTLKNLIKISNILNIPLISFFKKESESPSEFNEKSANYKPKKIDSNMEEILKDLSSTVRRQSEKIEQLEKELAYYKRLDAKKGAAS